MSQLAWVPLLQGCLSSALGHEIRYHVEDHVDPLRKTVVLDLTEPLPKGCWNPLQILAHGYANVNDCAISKIKRRTDKRYSLTLSIKRRRKTSSPKSPFEAPIKDSKAQRREEFRRRMRDKSIAKDEED